MRRVAGVGPSSAAVPRRGGLSPFAENCASRSSSSSSWPPPPSTLVGPRNRRRRGTTLTRAHSPGNGPEGSATCPGSGSGPTSSKPSSAGQHQPPRAVSASAEAAKYLQRGAKSGREERISGSVVGGHLVPRASVSARIEALKSVDVDLEPCCDECTSAAACELDKVVKRRARRQNLVAKLNKRRVVAGSVSWATRSAVSVCLSAGLVLNGKLVRFISHGYGIWAIITCINCNEKFQGDLLRKSFERALGTVIGGAAAMSVLYIDDFWVPEMMGWNARAEFYLSDVALFTMIGVYLRSQNKSSPAWDYSYFLAVLSFDFLLLDSFSDVNQYQDSIARIAMVTVGGIITCAVGLVLFPQYAGEELMALSADALEGTASVLEVSAAALVLSHGAHAYGANACPPPIDMGQVRRMVDAARYELRVFPADGTSHGPGERLFPRLSAKMDWFRYLTVCQRAQEVRELCRSASMFSQSGMSQLESMPSTSTSYQVELVVMVEEGASLLRFCADTLRRGRKLSARARGLSALTPFKRTKELRRSLDERLDRFRLARQALHERLDECIAPQPPPACVHFATRVSLQLAAVRLIAEQLEDRLVACAKSMEEVEAAGLLESPMGFPIVIKG